MFDIGLLKGGKVALTLILGKPRGAKEVHLL